MFICEKILIKTRIDDAINAVPIHLGCGIWGTLAIALFSDPEKIGTGLAWSEQMMIQSLGVFICGLWSFGVGMIFIKTVDHFSPLRVSFEREGIGLNPSEYGRTTELLDLLVTMDTQAKTEDLSLRVPVEPFTEVGQIAERYNGVMDALQKAVNKTEAIVRDIRDGIITFTQDGLINSFNPGAEKMFGYIGREIVGLSALTILTPVNAEGRDGLQFLIDQSSSSMDGHDKPSASFVGRRKNSSIFPIEITVAQSKIDENFVYTGLIRDITDRNHAEKVAANYRRQLEREQENLRKARDSLEARVQELSEARKATDNLLHDHGEMRNKAEEAEKRFRSLSKFSPVGISEFNMFGECIYTNSRWQAITDLSFEENLGSGWLSSIHSDDRREISSSWLPIAREGKEFSREFRITMKKGDLRWVHSRITALRTDEDQLTGYVSTIEDITDNKKSEDMIRASLSEKELLLREIHHRVKNNLQVVSSLLNMQSAQIKNEEALQIFKESQNRVKSMALIHEKLYSSQNLSKIKFDDYIRNLSTHLFRTYKIDSNVIILNLNIDKDILLGIDTAIPCGLILNELITNSVKYAFPQDKQGEITVEFCHNANGSYTLSVGDNGVGLPAGMDIKKTETLGMQLVDTLTEQVDGMLELDRKNGTRFRFTFNEIKYNERI